MWKGENHLIQHIERLIKKLFVSLLMSCVIVFPLNLRLIIESRCRASELASERVVWCGWEKNVKNEEWKKSIRIENFFLAAATAALMRFHVVPVMMMIMMRI